MTETNLWPPRPESEECPSSAVCCVTRFNLSAMDVSASMNGRHFQAPPAVGQSLPPACAAELSEDGEIFDSYDNDNLSSPSRIRTPSKAFKTGGWSHPWWWWRQWRRRRWSYWSKLAQNHSNGSTSRETNSILLDRPHPGRWPKLRLPSPPSLPKSPTHTADDFTTSSTAVTPGGKRHPLKMCVELFFLCYRSSADCVPSYFRTSDLCHGDCRRYSPSASILHSKYRLYRNKASIIAPRREIGKGLIPSYLAAIWPDWSNDLSVL